jgi:hypothetical protein
MEGLIQLIAGALPELLAPLAVILVSLTAFGAFALLGIVRYRRLRSGTPAKKTRLVLGLVVAFAGLLLSAWLLMEFVLFQSILKTATRHLSEKSGIEFSYASASGFFSTGRLRFKGASVRRSKAGQDAFHLRLDELSIDARPWSLLKGDLSLQSVRLVGIRGRYERVAGIERKPRKPLTADVLDVVDARVDWVLHREGKPDFSLPLGVERFQVRPFDSVNAAFTMLFRGDGAGSVADAPWAASGQGTGDARVTTWTATSVPVQLLAGFLGEPFDWFENGTVDVDVTDHWRHGEKTEVDLRWKLLFHDLRVAVPERIEGLRRRFGSAVAALANKHPRELSLEFTMTLDEKGLLGRMSPEGLELWDSLAAGLIDEFASRSGLPPDTARDLGRAVWGKLKSWLENRARGKR